MSPAKLFLFFLSFVASVSALATPHVARGVHHRALAGRVPLPAPVDVPALPIRKRQNSKRCRPRPSSGGEPIDAPATTRAAATYKANPDAPRPTTTHAAPEHVDQPKPAPTTQRPATTHQQAPAAPTNKPSSGGPSFMNGVQRGQGTFYATGLGACGITNKDTDYIAAVSHLLFDNFPGYKGGNPNSNPLCGRTVTATYKGKSVKVAITDRCEGCKVTDLDFSPSAFHQLADFSLGRIDGVQWTWD